MFSTPATIPLWVAVLIVILVAIFYGLMGALICAFVNRKKHLNDLQELAEAYEELDEQCDRLLAFSSSFSNGNTPTWLYVPKVFDLKDRPAMVDTSFALRFKKVDDIEKLINLIDENYRPNQVVTMRDILDFCYCPSCADDVYFGWKVSDILEQYRCIQETHNDPDSYWRMKLPTPHIIDPDLFPYPVEITFYDPEEILEKRKADHKEEPTTPPVILES